MWDAKSQRHAERAVRSVREVWATLAIWNGHEITAEGLADVLSPPYTAGLSPGSNTQDSSAAHVAGWVVEEYKDADLYLRAMSEDNRTTHLPPIIWESPSEEYMLRLSCKEWLQQEWAMLTPPGSGHLRLKLEWIRTLSVSVRSYYSIPLQEKISCIESALDRVEKDVRSGLSQLNATGSQTHPSQSRVLSAGASAELQRRAGHLGLDRTRLQPELGSGT